MKKIKIINEAKLNKKMQNLFSIKRFQVFALQSNNKLFTEKMLWMIFELEKFGILI